MIKTAGISFFESCYQNNKQVDFNMRHLDISCIPRKYEELPRYIIIRKPEDWYKSFYNFFIKVEGYMSFMLNDPEEDGYIYPISLNEFIKRSINLKDTLIKYPNKVRVFNNILQTQGNIHFNNSYYESHIEVGNYDTYEQFNMSLFEWNWIHVGGDTVLEENIIPLNKLNILEDIFDVNIGNSNKGIKRSTEEISEENLNLIRETHSRFYKLYNK